MKVLQLPEWVEDSYRTYGFIDHFDQYVSADGWTTVATDAGTVTLNDEAGGSISITPSDGTVADNDEIYVKRTKEHFLFAQNKPLVIEAQLKFTEANTDDANVAFGLMNAVAANSILDDGGGPAASYSGAVFFKEDGQTVWSVESSISTTQKTTQLTASNSLDGLAKTAGSTAYQRLRIESRPIDSVKHDVLFFIDGVLVAKHHDRTYTSATEMQVFFGMKNGAATNVETLVIRRCMGFQLY